MFTAQFDNNVYDKNVVHKLRASQPDSENFAFFETCEVTVHVWTKIKFANDCTVAACWAPTHCSRCYAMFRINVDLGCWKRTISACSPSLAWMLPFIFVRLRSNPKRSCQTLTGPCTYFQKESFSKAGLQVFVKASKLWGAAMLLGKGRSSKYEWTITQFTVLGVGWGFDVDVGQALIAMTLRAW